MNAPKEDPPHLRTLHKLVNVMTVVFILGFITIVIVIVMQFARVNTAATGPELPPDIALSGSETAEAVTFGKGWIAVVTIDQEGIERIHVYTPDGMPRQSMEIGHFE